ncbi:MAG: YeeE/YedE family protein [Cyclobacteriaceae bacterium]|nr:YeeE/YedE family protein [Cyclobacteriaceae bacterium HetDA_MAG_MS6]
MNFITDPWPWFVGGPLLAVLLFITLYLGERFGVSSTLETICSIGGASRFSDYFKFDWKAKMWNVVFVIGAAIGGFIASNFMTTNEPIKLGNSTRMSLIERGILNPGADFVPSIFSWENLFTLQGVVFMVLGGFLIGFGTRYADGCTSGHAISGLSDLQLPSFLAVIGFFVGGLFVTHFVLPYLL